MLDIIIPVYRGLAVTQRCVESVLSTVGEDAAVIVINDLSPEPELTAYLQQLAACRPQAITLLEHYHNWGFVATANQGMRLHPERDVILLNSDTEVSGNWYQRLQACAYRQANIATVTPFSNNATICSYPRFCEDNPLPDNTTLAQLDAACQQANAQQWLAIPTAVGFCMYIKRACIEQIGTFDEARFGHGYGEENEFCLRAQAQGWIHALSADTFVYHQGSVSFADSKAVHQPLGAKALLALYPHYDQWIAQFIQADPIAPYRQRIQQTLKPLSS